MNIHMTKNKIRTCAVSAVVAAGVLLTPAIGRPDYQPAPAPQQVLPAVDRDAPDSAALAAFARAHHLAGLSPASLSPVRRVCRGLSPASAQGCPVEVFVSATLDDSPASAQWDAAVR